MDSNIIPMPELYNKFYCEGIKWKDLKNPRLRESYNILLDRNIDELETTLLLEDGAFNHYVFAVPSQAVELKSFGSRDNFGELRDFVHLYELSDLTANEIRKAFTIENKKGKVLASINTYYTHYPKRLKLYDLTVLIPYSRNCKELYLPLKKSSRGVGVTLFKQINADKFNNIQIGEYEPLLDSDIPIIRDHLGRLQNIANQHAKDI